MLDLPKLTTKSILELEEQSLLKELEQLHKKEILNV